ncbi:NAD(P)H-dependent oxidoreductase [Oscillospiraceae bacterium CM]|nr:NAD(P)H-dependent oxidoreductase [Oscillospiraceae bacterium CM]
MKIVAILSSFRNEGNTKQILSLLQKHVCASQDRHGMPCDFEIISLASANLSFCRGCRLCFDKGETSCPLHDGFFSVYQSLQNADAVILASPVYVEDVSAAMKNFIDRMAFNCHRPAFAGKPALIVATSGMGSSNHAVRSMIFALSSWGFQVVGKRKFRMGALMDPAAMPPAFDDAARRLISKLMRAISRQEILKPSFYALLVFKVQQKCFQNDLRYRNTYDHDYWARTGWLNPRCTYYKKHTAWPIKTACAQLLGAVIARILI